VVYGIEYYFGAGIHQDQEGETPYGKPVQVVDLGTTHIPKEVFDEYLQEISSQYTPETYNLLTHNCNNFTNEVAQFLVEKTIPSYILDLPKDVMSSPMGALISKNHFIFLPLHYVPYVDTHFIFLPHHYVPYCCLLPIWAGKG
jgi:desumoylating isopeptidase 1